MSNDRGTQCTIHTFHAAATNVQKYLRVYIQHSVHCKDYMEHTAVDESDFIKIKVPHELQSQNAKLAVGKVGCIANCIMMWQCDVVSDSAHRQVSFGGHAQTGGMAACVDIDEQLGHQ